MSKKITFDKYRKRTSDYHWRQVGRNLFWFNAYVSARYLQVIKLIRIRGNQMVLDIGCGDGVLLSLVTRGKLYGVDADQDSLNYASTKIRAKLIKASAESLPFRSGFYDVVVATEIIEHLSKPELMLNEIKRVLKPGGRVIITTPVKLPEGLTDRLHVREFSPEELRQLCLKYFKSVSIKTSHPLWLKRIYTMTLGRIGRFHLDFGRWLINGVVLLIGWNPFLNLPGQPSQQLAVCKK